MSSVRFRLRRRPVNPGSVRSAEKHGSWIWGRRAMRVAPMPVRKGVHSGARRAALLCALLLGGQALVACGGGANAGARPTLNFYIYPDNSGAVQQAVDTCTKNSGGRYVIKYQKLPTGADGQRQQMVRRLAARDGAMDILGLDVTWAPEFAQAGWIREWTGSNKAQVEQGTLAGPIQTATFNGKLYAAPFNSNTQLLWYRSDLVPTPPKTWDEMIDMSIALAKAGKPHY